MIELIESKAEQIRDLCRKHRVRSLFVFGSAATGEFDPATSDIDFLVEFLPDAPRTGLGGAYFTLRSDLASLLGHPVDLAEAGAVRNRFVRATVERSKVPIYAAA